MKRPTIASILSLPIVIAGLSALIVIAVNWQAFSLYWPAPFVQGWDGQGQASAGQYYADHIFPSLWGWTSAWYAGMPLPQFYPPLLYVSMAIAHRAIPWISYVSLFKILTTALQIALPGILVYFVSRRTKSPLALWVTAIFSICLISSYFDEFGDYGMNIISTLNTGMIAQLLGFIFLICWLHFFLKIEVDRRARYLSGLFLFLTFLSNAHDDIATFFIFLGIFIASIAPELKGLALGRSQGRKTALSSFIRKSCLYFLCGFLPLAATAFWTLPLLAIYRYLVTTPTFSLPTLWQTCVAVAILPLVVVLSLFISKKFQEKDLGAIALAAALIIFGTYLCSSVPNPLVPVQANRWIGIAAFLLPLMAGLCFAALEGKILGRRRVAVFVCAIFCIFIGTGNHGTDPTSVNGYYLNYAADDYPAVLAYIKSHRAELGITAVEAAETDQSPQLFIYDSLFGQYGGGASAFILRESSIDSVYMTPVRNSLSLGWEGWGFRSFLMFDTDFTKQSMTKSLDRAREMGIQSFFVRSKYDKDRLGQDPRIRLAASFGNWSLYAFADAVPRAEILQNEPIVFYGDLTFKNRDIAGYDWSRFQEELLFNDDQKTSFIYAGDQNLDTSADLNASSEALVSSMRYADEKTALKRLLDYSKTKKLIVVAQYDPLYYALRAKYLAASSTQGYRISFIDRLSPTPMDPNPLRAQLAALYASTSAETSAEQAAVPASGLSIVRTTIGDSRISVELSGTSSTPVPVIIKNTYFPAWKRADGAPIYLASPGFIGTFATSSFDIGFATPDYVYWGWLITALAVIGTFSLSRLDATDRSGRRR